ncbi:aldehyde dehydrogenase family protein [Agreia sp. PsM10]|uniref:aldehyde dehydrogenase family protein n=1 Tax=Agreia sp. PsM10 TaxID=3030533 RepID=UPI00263A985E|nr:aldehyde dehydrogenase family protein [Agreia sp. PsM10]MDN4642279.1 aldehyde dehydrogenase family protein [Agreia sp. PsM10]
MPLVTTTDPTTGESRELDFSESDAAEVRAAVDRAVEATADLDARGRLGRAELLDAIADALEARRVDIVAAADSETALGETRLNGELTRTTYQLRFFGEVLREGSYLEATIDHAGDTPMGPRPDLRRMLLPLGPVAVYAASNFPLAFSVAGGDTAAALAAGCGVVVKAHPAHPATSDLVGRIVQSVAGNALSVVYGREAGIMLVTEPAIRAAGFTGSPGGGRALADLAAARPEPIPFYGELGSLNPVIVSPEAARTRATEIGTGLSASIVLGGGQFCTKPGIVLVPDNSDGEQLVRVLARDASLTAAKPALTTAMAHAYAAGVDALAGETGATLAVEARDAADGATSPTVVAFDGDEFTGALLEECFGPVAVVARYRDDAHAARLLESLPASLTGSLFVDEDDRGVPLARKVVAAKSGRILYNQYPTGVAVSWAQNHGGSWPSTNSVHTSVGATSIRRFLRPVAWQNAPQTELPEELRDAYEAVPRRVDGRLVLPAE